MSELRIACPRERAPALGETSEMFRPKRSREWYAQTVLKKIFAALAAALALIIVPPAGEAERQLPVVLDLKAHHEACGQNGCAGGEAIATPTPVAFAWAL
jgi:hypothetical protein